MAITLRSTKGSPLTHTEVDNNFRQFYYSSSIEGSAVIFHRFTAISSSVSFPVNPPRGKDHYIQIKAGNALSGSGAIFTGSANFVFDYNNNHLKVTGSHTHIGSSTITGNLVVGGTVTAEEFISEKVATTYIYKSGSTKFGDTADDTHSFTGSVQLQGSLTGSDVSINTWGSVSASLASNLTYSQNTSASLASTITANSQSAAAAYLRNTTDIFDGDLTVTGRLTAQEFHTEFVSASVIFESGSTQFGNSSDDTHSFTGDVSIVGNLAIPGFNNVSSSLASLLPDNSQDVTLNTTSHNYLSISGQEITLGQIDISDDTNLGVSDTTGQTGIDLTLTGDTLSGVVSGLTTSSNAQFNSFGVGTAASGVAGEIRATGDVVAFYSSDERLKDNIKNISNPIDKVKQIGGYEFDWNENSTHTGHDVGVIAQEIEKVLPELVTIRDNGYKAVRYEKIVALLIEAVKEQQSQIEDLKSRL
jgi:hypothetical protein